MELIDKAELLKQIDIDSDGKPGWYGDTWQFIETIKNMPAIYAVSEWIPCSESLPEEQGQYLVTFPVYNGESCVYVLSFCKGKFYETDDEYGDAEYDDVIAWMPLPEPWKGASDEYQRSNYKSAERSVRI